ncbi:hypothetical protein [Kibdelosporangium philippinense]|uniref:hypothetical protein n=1 Tax=Kibdelosporangium philippinense TaxID=211113 RepID=UPI00361892B3
MGLVADRRPRVLTVVALAAFVWVEKRVPSPPAAAAVQDPQLHDDLGAGVHGRFAMFGAVSFLPQYQQIVQGASATNSGLLQLPMMAGMLVVSTVVGQLTSRTATTAPSRSSERP